MEKKITLENLSLKAHLSIVRDPRVEGRCEHKLTDILTIALFAVISGAEGFEEMQEYGKNKEEWLKTFLELENGIPSHDTFNRVLSCINPEELSKVLTNWLVVVAKELQKKCGVAIDGKTLRRTFDKASKKGPLHLVSAFATETGLVLGQKKTSEKSNEITAIPQLIRQLELKGYVVTIDAMGCQKEIAKEITEAKADYILALKENHQTMHQDVMKFFEFEDATGWKESEKFSFHKEVSKGHGRLEIRRTCNFADRMAC